MRRVIALTVKPCRRNRGGNDSVAQPGVEARKIGRACQRQLWMKGRGSARRLLDQHHPYSM